MKVCEACGKTTVAAVDHLDLLDSYERIVNAFIDFDAMWRVMFSAIDVDPETVDAKTYGMLRNARRAAKAHQAGMAEYVAAFRRSLVAHHVNKGGAPCP